MIVKIAAILALALLGACGWVRMAPDDPARWHVDPVTAEGTGKPNEAFVRGADAPFFPETPAHLMERFDRMAMAQPRTTRLAGDPAEGFATYVQRSALWRFPDYVSVRAVPEEGGSRLNLWSRSRYGYGDLGVNSARVKAWLDALEGQGG
jgi:uncharacterized protein (DUF1499 family)